MLQAQLSLIANVKVELVCVCVCVCGVCHVVVTLHVTVFFCIACIICCIASVSLTSRVNLAL